MRPRGYDLGDWLAVCYQCGRTRLASELKKHWQGYYVCPEHWESRHPQDFVRGVADEQRPPWVQPPTDLEIGVCTLNGLSAIPGYAQPGCSIPGRTFIDYSIPAPVLLTACTIYTRQGVPGWGIPGCAIPGHDPFAA